MELYTTDDLKKDVSNNDGSRSFFFDCKDEKMKDYQYEVTISNTTLHLAEEIEKNGGGQVVEFAIMKLNDQVEKIENEKEAKGFFEEIST